MANNKYKWEFENIGGSSRVKIRNGEDIAHLAELDPKMWTVLSCPVTGLEIDDKSLAYMDCDSDGKIRVNDVIATAQWMTAALKNPDLLLEGSCSIDICGTDMQRKKSRAENRGIFRRSRQQECASDDMDFRAGRGICRYGKGNRSY